MHDRHWVRRNRGKNLKYVRKIKSIRREVNLYVKFNVKNVSLSPQTATITLTWLAPKLDAFGVVFTIRRIVPC